MFLRRKRKIVELQIDKKELPQQKQDSKRIPIYRTPQTDSERIDLLKKICLTIVQDAFDEEISNCPNPGALFRDKALLDEYIKGI